MLIAVTGATGFVGRYIVNHLIEQGHRCRCWFRPESDRGGFIDDDAIDWMRGELNDQAASDQLVEGVDAMVHAGLDRSNWKNDIADDFLGCVETNTIGSIRLIQSAKRAGVGRFVFISTCAVHEFVMDDRKLDEAHPLWPRWHYGAYKAAVEKFVHSFGLGREFPVCALRPTGVYGVTRPIENSKWFDIVRDVAAGKPIRSEAGGKEVHAADVARAVDVLLNAPMESITGQAFNCYDMYVADQDVAGIAKLITGSKSEIIPLNTGPKNQIDTSKIRSLGMTFGGIPLLEGTVKLLLNPDSRIVDLR